MYPFFRLITKVVQAVSRKPIAHHDMSTISFYCRPWDIDMFGEMNNGRVLTLYDLGRFDLVIRAGLSQKLKKLKLGLVVAGSTVRYRRRIHMFQKVTQHTQFVAMDDRWLYIMQSMWVKGQPASSVLLRTGITRSGKTVPTDEVLKLLQITDWQPRPEGWVKSWIDCDDERPWPPEQPEKA